MSEPSPNRFDLTGEYGGIVRDAAGKRRLRLRVPGGEWLLKVPRLLRRRIMAGHRGGETIRLTGDTERNAAGEAVRRVVVEILPVPGAPVPRATVGPIQVCTKKNCWRQGGRELWTALERGLAAGGLSGQITLEGVGCLDRCRMAPNAEWQGCAYKNCSPADAPEIIARAAAPAD